MHIHAQRKWICFRRGCNSEVDLVPSLNHKSYHNFYHKFDHTCGLGVQGKLSWRTWHYPRCTGEAIVAYLALSKGGYRVHYATVATIQGWIWGPLCNGGHYPWEHYPKVVIIQESVNWQLLSKAFLGSTIQGWPLSKSQLIGNYCQKPFLGPLSKGGHYPRIS